MEQTSRVNSWLKGAIAIALIGFALNFPGMRSVRVVHAQAAEAQTSAAGFSWEYQLDFSDSSPASARQQAASLTPSLNGQGVASELQALGGSNYRLAMTGSQGVEQVRQVLYSPLMAGFIGGAAELEVDMPVGSLLDTTLKLESNLTTGYSWEVVPSESAGFAQAGEPTFTAQSSGHGVPSVQTLVLHPTTMGDGKVKLVYRRPFGPDEAATRHLRITFAAQPIAVDLSNPSPKVISLPAGSSKSPNAPNPIDQIPVKGTLPASLDWRTSGIVPAVRNQGACGACWAFGTVGIMESVIAKAGGPLTDLSEQFLVSCNTSGWDCAGGLTAHMWHYDTLGLNQSSIGAVLETDDPYTATDTATGGSCSVVPYNHPYTLSGWQFIVPNEWTMPTVDQIKNAIYTYGPVTAGVCAGPAFQSYHGGIFSTDETDHCTGVNFSPFQTNHQIILVGWNDAGGYWILRNQWGTYWGESGYMRIAYNTSRVGEGTSWVTWTAAAPAPFSKSGPADAATSQPANPTLSWAASSGAASYEYCIDDSSNDTCNTSWISTGTTSVPLSGLAPGNHSWQVHAKNTFGSTEADGGTWWSFTVNQTSQIYLPLVLRDFAGPPPGGGIVNGDFESGSTGWTEFSTHGYPIIVTSFAPNEVTAHNGSYAAWLGGDDDETSYVQQQVTIPSSAPYLVYWQWIGSSDFCGHDFGSVVINGSEEDADVYDLCTATNTGGWVTHSVDLSAYVGQSVTLQIRAETDSSNVSNLFVDDVSLQASAAASGQINGVAPNLDALTTQGKIGILVPGEKPQKRLLNPR